MGDATGARGRADGGKRRWITRCVAVLNAGVMVTGVIAADAAAQTRPRVRGEVTDEWGNALEGVRVSGRWVMDADTGLAIEDAEPRETTTNDDGRFNLANLAGGDWVFEFRGEGYVPIGVAMQLAQADAFFAQPPLEIELAAAPPGSRIRNDTEFGTDDGSLTLRLKADGQFEFSDAEGEGEGTYGIVELEGALTVRDYDGDDDKFSITEPVVVTFANELFNSLTWGEATLSEK